VVWLVFYLLGMTTLLPWNFFIAVNDYWNFKVARGHGSEVWKVSPHYCSFATSQTTARSTPSSRRSSHPILPLPPMFQTHSSSS
jgi:equilibrative nucleoside transporter 1/2/3